MAFKSTLLLVFLTLAPTSGVKFSCSKSTYCSIFIWAPWSACSTGCGRGIRYRLPGLCCPAGVTADTIFEECAVKVCHMTESEYNQTEVCQATDKCSPVLRETNYFRPFGLVTLVIGSAILLATVTSGAACIVLGIKRYRKRREKPPRNSVTPK